MTATNEAPLFHAVVHAISSCDVRNVTPHTGVSDLCSTLWSTPSPVVMSGTLHLTQASVRIRCCSTDFYTPAVVISELSVVMDDVHVVYNASTGPLGVVFVILLLSPRRLQCCAWSPSGVVSVVVMHRFTHANLKSTSSVTLARALPWELRS